MNHPSRATVAASFALLGSALFVLPATSVAAAPLPVAKSITATAGVDSAAPISVKATFTSRVLATQSTKARVLLLEGAKGSGRRSTLGSVSVPAIQRRRTKTITATFKPSVAPGTY
ncbi:MAG: hypothetical protein Q7T55_06605, partial [Solirubrobacteraceae bacterium]|nr:hypothetical protein [Solirubrobacteraceae bacterium]